MAHSSPVRVRVCADCDGFPLVVVTTAASRRNGSRSTTCVSCPACRGTGTRPTVASRTTQYSEVA
ncbi:hypothetical protein OID54_13475 [Streptomyces sp. NBC_00690]